MLSSTLWSGRLMSPFGDERAGDIDQAIGLGRGAEGELPWSPETLDRWPCTVTTRHARARHSRAHSTSHGHLSCGDVISRSGADATIVGADTAIISMAVMPHNAASSSSRRSNARSSKLHGYGVFAPRTINKNKRIIDYAGELITNKQSEAREDRYLRKGCIWVFRVNRNWSRDANVGGNVARFINHSCTPNCWIEVVRQDDLDPRRQRIERAKS